MAMTTPTQIRIEEETKKQAISVLDGLGLNLPSAVNIFLKQVILQKGIPFEVKYPGQNCAPAETGHRGQGQGEYVRRRRQPQK